MKKLLNFVHLGLQSCRSSVYKLFVKTFWPFYFIGLLLAIIYVASCINQKTEKAKIENSVAKVDTLSKQPLAEDFAYLESRDFKISVLNLCTARIKYCEAMKVAQYGKKKAKEIFNSSFDEQISFDKAFIKQLKKDISRLDSLDGVKTNFNNLLYMQNNVALP